MSDETLKIIPFFEIVICDKICVKPRLSSEMTTRP